MTAKRTLAELAANFAKKTTGGGGDQNWRLFFPFWKAPEGSTSTIRFLPDTDENNPMEFLVENLTHELVINGKREKVACLKMYEDYCPICALSSKYYDKKDPDHNEALGKKYYRKKSYIGQVLVIETPVEHNADQLVKLIDFGPAVFNQIQSAFQSGDMDRKPQEFKGGYNFRIKKTKAGEYASYSTSSFSPKPTDIADDLLATIQPQMYDLKAYRAPKVGREQLEAMLIADQTGQSLEMPEEDSAPAPAPAAAPITAGPAKVSVTSATVATPAPAPAPAAGGKLSVMEQLKARQAARAAAQAQGNGDAE